MSLYRLRQEGLAWSDVAGEMVLLDLHGSKYFTATGSGSFLIQRLIDGQDEQQLQAALCESFDVSPETAAVDVAAFLEELKRLDLIESVTETSA